MNITIDRVSMTFQDGNNVLNDISMSSDARALALIGPSGGGKSTLLRIIGGLLTPTSGKVFIDGEEKPQNEASLVKYRRKLGFVFQQNGLFMHLSALDNITLPLKTVHGFDAKRAGDEAMSLLSRFGLADAAKKRPGELSGGQQQRVAIARAIAPKPKLLLLDEPTSALDPEYTAEVLDMIDELRGEGLYFIIVTHEMGFAKNACDSVAFLYGGDILESGSSSEVFLTPRTDELKRFLHKLLSWSA